MAVAARGMEPRGASRRRWVHAGTLAWALLLRWLTAPEAAALAAAALTFNVALLPRLGLNLSKPGTQEAAAWRGIRLYPFTVLLLIVLFPRQLYIAGAGWAVLALGDPAASWWGERHGERRWWGGAKTRAGTLAYWIAGAIGAGGFLWYLHAPGAPARLALAATAAAGAAALLEALPLRLDDNLLPPLVAAGVMALVLAERVHWALPARILEATAVCGAFALAAWALRLVTGRAALAGFAVALAIYCGLGRGGFACLLAFFVLGAAATRLGYGRKLRLGAAERRGGRREWNQVLANGLVPAIAALLGLLTGARAWAAAAAVAALAEAASDTMASEIGQAFGRRAYSIVGGKPVAVGADGGISAAGTAAGALGAALVAATAAALGLVTWPAGAWLAAIGLLGNLWDSVLGAVWEQRGALGNDEVNFLATLAAALAAVLIARL